MNKTTKFTSVTALPAGITRDAVIETLHNHGELIDLQPQVVERHPCRPPSWSSAEEFHCSWYSITDRVSYLPGIKGKVTYHGCFNDLDDGLQTHIFAPMGLEMKNRWTIGGNMPGQPRARTELGLGLPKDGLYLREDVEIKCSVLLTSFVKSNMKKAHTRLVDRLIEKAHRLEADAHNARIARHMSVQSTSLSDSIVASSGGGSIVGRSDVLSPAPSLRQNMLVGGGQPAAPSVQYLSHSQSLPYHAHTSPPASQLHHQHLQQQQHLQHQPSVSMLSNGPSYYPPPMPSPGIAPGIHSPAMVGIPMRSPSAMSADSTGARQFAHFAPPQPAGAGHGQYQYPYQPVDQTGHLIHQLPSNNHPVTAASPTPAPSVSSPGPTPIMVMQPNGSYVRYIPVEMDGSAATATTMHELAGSSVPTGFRPMPMVVSDHDRPGVGALTPAASPIAATSAAKQNQLGGRRSTGSPVSSAVSQSLGSTVSTGLSAVPATPPKIPIGHPVVRDGPVTGQRA